MGVEVPVADEQRAHRTAAEHARAARGAAVFHRAVDEVYRVILVDGIESAAHAAGIGRSIGLRLAVTDREPDELDLAAVRSVRRSRVDAADRVIAVAARIRCVRADDVRNLLASGGLDRQRLAGDDDAAVHGAVVRHILVVRAGQDLHRIARRCGFDRLLNRSERRRGGHAVAGRVVIVVIHKPDVRCRSDKCDTHRTEQNHSFFHSIPLVTTIP